MSDKDDLLTSKLKAVPRRRLYEEIVAQIKSLIDDGGLQPGDQLPPERKLAEAFNVSRHSVREAIRSLERDNVLLSRPGSGTFVMVGSSQAVVDYLARAVLKEKDKLAEIFQFREMLEPQIAALAAENATPGDVTQLEELLDQQKQANSRQILIQLDSEFHLTLARCTGNEVLSSVVERINDILSQTRLEALQSPTRNESSLMWHERIVRAIAEHNPEKAADAMTNHLKLIKEMVLLSR
jgi:GntR family transcriptional repressor for pyruvate dehydrogenase complex